MRERGWQVPAYSFPENREDLVALRVVVRNGYSRDPADMFVEDLKRLVARLEKQSSPAHDESYAGFTHWGSASVRMLPARTCRSSCPASWLRRVDGSEEKGTR
jgi:glutamate decarboxylase